jgi:hypothetical protein
MALQRQQNGLIGLLLCAGKPVGQELLGRALPQYIIKPMYLHRLTATDHHPPAIGEAFA